jgi:hypothetical protein
MPRVLMVYPEFRSASFWNYRDTVALMDAKYPAAPLGLITVAAMLPPGGSTGGSERGGAGGRGPRWAEFIFTAGCCRSSGLLS